MFENLDDPDGFVAGESLFAGTVRRTRARRRKAAALRAVGGIVCIVGITPALLRDESPVGKTQPASDTAEADTIGPPIVVETAPPVSEPVDTFPTSDLGATNFLVIGTDDASCSGADGRSDTIMVLRLDAANRRAALLSIPRDLWVKVPGEGMARINSTYRPNDPQQLIDTINNEFGVVVDHYIQLDYCSFKTLVDSIGGVAVPFDTPVRDTATGLSVAQAGCSLLDGTVALAYVRSRHFEYQDSTGLWHEDPSSDLGRMARQQDFLERLLHSASTAGVLKPAVIPGLYDAYRRDLVTDTGMTIDKMINFIGTISKIAPSNIRNYQIEVTGQLVAGSDVFIWNPESASMKSILDLFRGLAPLVGDAQPTAIDRDTATTAPNDTSPVPNRPAAAIVPGTTSVC